MLKCNGCNYDLKPIGSPKEFESAYTCNNHLCPKFLVPIGTITAFIEYEDRTEFLTSCNCKHISIYIESFYNILGLVPTDIDKFKQGLLLLTDSFCVSKEEESNKKA